MENNVRVMISLNEFFLDSSVDQLRECHKLKIINWYEIS